MVGTDTRTFSAAELSSFNGNGSPVYIAVKGVVYDVSAGASFYGPGGPYSVFAGRECARALATMRIDPNECTAELEGLSEKDLKTLEDWIKKFEAKYPRVGYLAP